MNESNATILVNSCDSYEDTWYPFFQLLKKYWSGCPFQIVLNTESKKYEDIDLDIKCFSFYKSGVDVSYGKRLIKHLEIISSRYIIMLMDDFFIRSNVNEEKVLACIEFLEHNADVAYISFDAVKDQYNVDDGALEDFVLRPQCGEYKVNLQAGIWRREKLLHYVRSHESPWELETKGSIRSFETTDRFYAIKDVSLSPINYGKKTGLTWGIVRGRWVKDDVCPLFEKEQIEVDLLKRGFFDKNDFVDITVPPKDICRDVKSYGISLFMKMKCWSFFRFLKKILYLSYDVDWVAYRRRKEELGGRK